MIGIVDTGGANHASIQNALTRLNRRSLLSVDHEELSTCSHLILPGVGHAEHAMSLLKKHALVEYLRAQTKPVLGICLGMQILFDRSDEGDTQCLGLLPGRVKRLESNENFRVPHMGWSQLELRSQQSHLLAGIDPGSYFYFVHSFVVPDSEWVVAATPNPHPIPSVVEWRNFYAVQFHPERSADAGARLLGNFIARMR